jgi:hypothetical protein
MLYCGSGAHNRLLVLTVPLPRPVCGTGSQQAKYTLFIFNRSHNIERKGQGKGIVLYYQMDYVIQRITAQQAVF